MRQLQEGVELFTGVVLTTSNINHVIGGVISRGGKLGGGIKTKKIIFGKLVGYN